MSTALAQTRRRPLESRRVVGAGLVAVGVVLVLGVILPRILFGLAGGVIGGFFGLVGALIGGTFGLVGGLVGLTIGLAAGAVGLVVGIVGLVLGLLLVPAILIAIGAGLFLSRRHR